MEDGYSELKEVRGDAECLNLSKKQMHFHKEFIGTNSYEFLGE